MEKLLDKDSVILAIYMSKVIREFHCDFIFPNDTAKFKDNNGNSIFFNLKVNEDNEVIPVGGKENIRKEFENYEFFLETPDLTERLIRRRSINEITTNLCKIGNTITKYNISSEDFKEINEKFNNLFEEINNKYGVR